MQRFRRFSQVRGQHEAYAVLPVLSDLRQCIKGNVEFHMTEIHILQCRKHLLFQRSGRFPPHVRKLPGFCLKLLLLFFQKNRKLLDPSLRLLQLLLFLFQGLQSLQNRFDAPAVFSLQTVQKIQTISGFLQILRGIGAVLHILRQRLIKIGKQAFHLRKLSRKLRLSIQPVQLLHPPCGMHDLTCRTTLIRGKEIHLLTDIPDLFGVGHPPEFLLQLRILSRYRLGPPDLIDLELKKIGSFCTFRRILIQPFQLRSDGLLLLIQPPNPVSLPTYGVIPGIQQL